MMIRETTYPIPYIIKGFNDGKATSIAIVSIKSKIAATPNAIRNLNIHFIVLSFFFNRYYLRYLCLIFKTIWKDFLQKNQI
jgi:hypothetical protein